jgi:dethiobiotin synthetase
MKFFITGTDTDIGKTLISCWLTMHSNFGYFKPIQTGIEQDSDCGVIQKYSSAKIYPEIYRYKAPLSPHLAASLENQEIDLNKISLPEAENLIIEGAGGVLVPINKKYYMIDLIKKLNIPAIIVARSALGTINHSLLTIEALRARNIPIAGVILNGEIDEDNKKAIEFYGKINVLAQFPLLRSISKKDLLNIPLTQKLKLLFDKGKYEHYTTR